MVNGDKIEDFNQDLYLCSDGGKKEEGRPVQKSKNNFAYPMTLPSLYLHTNREGEFDSSFQKQLRVAKLCHMLGLPEALTEWRFPKAQVPSRPDFSRNSMPLYRRTGRPTLTPSSKDADEPFNTPKYHTKVSANTSFCNFRKNNEFKQRFNFSNILHRSEFPLDTGCY